MVIASSMSDEPEIKKLRNILTMDKNIRFDKHH
jgi:hypothetical protein